VDNVISERIHTVLITKHFFINNNQIKKLKNMYAIEPCILARWKRNEACWKPVSWPSCSVDSSPTVTPSL